MADQSTREARKSFERLLEEAGADTNVVGLFLGGSRGKGRESKESDYDVYVIVPDGVVKSYRQKYGRRSSGMIEISVMSESEYRAHAAIDGPDAANRYDFAHVEALLDRNGRIQRLIQDKGVSRGNGSSPMPPAVWTPTSAPCTAPSSIGRMGIPSPRDWNRPDQFPFCSMPFRDRRGRVRPYYKYLRWELETLPLAGFPMTPAQLQATIIRILTTGDAESQRKLFLAAERTARRAGYGKVFDSWVEHRLGLGVRRFQRHDE